MKLFRVCLLMLLSFLLPVQAALAAGAGGCLRHVSQGMPATVAAAAAGEDAAVADHSACAGHAVAAGGVAGTADPGQAFAADAGCNSCGLCGLASAMPSPSLQWNAARSQQAPEVVAAAGHLSTVGRTLERPPRASAAAR